MNKIRDIVPPSPKKHVSAPKKKRSPKLLIISLAVIVILAVAWLASGYYSKLTLEIIPRTEEISFLQEIEVNINQDVLDIENKIVPGKFFEGNKQSSLVFETRGVASDGKKAEGMIKVFNSHNPPRTFAFRETTRFVSADGGKVFRAPDKVFLPAATLTGGKITPSITEVMVVAQEQGDEYNIGKSNFSVPGLSGSSYYYTIWAESEEPMTGGYIEEVSMVTEQDLDEAKVQLKQELIKLAKNDIGTGLPQDYVLREDFFFTKSFEHSCSQEAGDIVEEFTCTGDISVQGLGFRLSNIKDIVVDQLNNEVPSEKSFSADLVLEFVSKNLVSETGKMILDFETKVMLFDKMSEEIIALQVKDKTEKQIKQDIFETYPFIDSINTHFWPFWVKKAPKVLDRIQVIIKP